MLKRFSFLFLLIFFLLSFRMAEAFWTSDATTASGQIFHPVLDESRYFTIYSSQTLQQKQFRTGAYLNYARKPLKISTAGTGTTLGTTVQDLVMADLYGSVGIMDWWQVGLDVPVAYERFMNPNVAAPSATNVIGMGDVRLETKFRLLDIEKYNVGLALLPFVTIPTGNGDKYIGNNSFTGGIHLIADFDIVDRLQLAINVGYMNRDNYAIPARGIRLDDQFLYGAGASFILTQKVHLIAQAFGASTLRDYFDFDVVRELPLEVDGGVRIFPTQALSVTAGGGAGLTIGYGSPVYRAFVGLAYTRPREVELPPPPPEPIAFIKDKEIVITRKIHFEFNKAVIRPVSFPILQAVADVLQQNPHVRKVQVEGHTDWIGGDQYNLELSQGRSESVRQWLIEHGVEANRLTAKGFGETQPLASNETALGRAKNRRVTFTIIEQD
ncbi:MAG: OmpA family protein [bacterium]|nr:OmpA family protein [bacterium]